MTIRKKVEEGARKTAVPSVTASRQIPTKPSIPVNEVPEGGERVDQIREILFGAQRQEYERRLAQLEELLVKNITELSKETAARFASLQQETDKKFARLEELLVKSISDVSRDIERKMDSHTSDNDKRFKQMEQRVDEALSELKKEVAHQFNLQKNEYIQKFGSLEEKLPKIVAEINKRMEAEVASLTRSIDTSRSESTRSVEQLERQKMDRISLAKLLHGAAAGIEGKEPKADVGGK
jgi:DNA anti-recombination protein RmuC